MSDKSHVSIGYLVDPYTGEEHDNHVLLDKRLKETLDRRTFMGFELTQASKDLSTTHLLVIESDNDPNQPDVTVTLNRRLAVSREVTTEVFTDPNINSFPFIFVNKDAMDLLAEMFRLDKETLQALPEEETT